MEMKGYGTKVFGNLFPDYDTFKEWFLSTPFGSKTVPNEITFTLIAYEYNDCHLCMNEKNFKEHFAVDLYTYTKEFEKTTERIDKLMELTEDDISTDSTSVMNIATIPENSYDTDSETVNFVTTQQKNINKKGKSNIQREMLSNSRSYTVKTFLRRFKHLFISVLSPSYVKVYREDVED